jgi:outer membrane biosynthesis protein TonB
MTPVIRAYLRAAAEGDANLVRGLLAQGTDVNSVNQAGQTALMLAAGFNRREVVSLLLAAGANTELQDDLGLTAVDWAENYIAIAELIESATKPVEAVAQPPARIQEVAPPVVKSILQPAETPVRLQTEEPALKGLAGAILRDHKTRVGDPQPINSTPAPQSSLEPELSPDDTLDKPLSQIDDTAASARPVTSRSRIFDLDSTNNTPRPVSKVEVTVPSFDTQNSNRRTFLWVLLLIAFAAVGFGTYRFGRSVFSTPITNNESPSSTPTPRTQSPPPDIKKLPIVRGDLAGAELHLADVEYPADQAKGQSGTVNVHVQVSQKGIVFAAKAIDGDEVFRAAAEKAAKSSAFAPYKLVDKSSVVEGTITYTFVPGQQSGSKSVAEHGVTASAGGPLAGTELKLVKPDYSSNADQEDAARTVTVVVRVSRSGRVVSWRFLDGDQRLHGAVLNAVRRSTFDPAKLNGNGDVVGTITYTFN